MTAAEADRIRARLDALAAEEAVNPSRIWEPVAEFTDEQVRLCHEATEFDHGCVVCAAVDVRPDEAVPGTDF